MSKLAQKREELAAKQKALAAIFEEAGPDLDLSKVTSLSGDTAAKVAEIRRRNEELTALGKEIEALKAMEDAARNTREIGETLRQPATSIPHPTGAQPAKTLGQLFVESEAYKGYSSVHRSGPVSEVKGEAVTRALQLAREQKTTLDETTWPLRPVRTGVIVPGALRQVQITQLIPPGTTDQNAIVYLEETTTTNAAAPTAEGALAPESALGFTERSVPIRKIVTVLPVTNELLADAPAVRSYVDARLGLFLDLAEESQIISGNGVAPNMTGLYNVTGIQTQARGADPAPDAFYKAIVKIQTGAYLQPSGVVMHPNDWQNIRLLRTADGIYIWGSPAEAGPERLWGLPVVSSTAATPGTGLVAAFDSATQYYTRENISFAVSDQHADFFVRGQLMLRVEKRGALVVYRPAAICTVTGL